MSWHHYGSKTNKVMTEESSFALTVVWIQQPIYFGYTIRCVSGSKHLINTLNFSTGKQHNTEILMTFTSDFIWRKILSWQFFFKVVYFSYYFLMVDSDDNNLCFKFGISLWSFLDVSPSWFQWRGSFWLANFLLD